MPSIKDAVQKNQNLIKAGANLVSEFSEVPQVQKPLPPTPVTGLPVRGVYNPNQILAPDFLNNTTAMRTGVNLRSATFPPQQQESTVTKTVVQETQASAVSSALTIKVNNLLAPLQTLINFLSTSSVAVAVDANGNLTFTASATGDGLIHGDSIWEIDPACVYLRDDFVSILDITNTALFSENAWQVITPTTGVFAWPSAFPCLGGLKFINAGTSAESSFMQLGNQFTSAAASTPSCMWPLMDFPDWKMIWVFELAKADNTATTDAVFNWAQVSFYLGLANYGILGTTPTISTVPRPQFFVGLRYDTDTTSPSIGDTEFVFEAVSNQNATSATRANLNAQGNTSSTGISAVEGHQYRFEMLCTSKNSVQMTLIDGTAGTSYVATLTVPSFSLTSDNISVFGQSSSSTLTLIKLENSSAANIAAPFGPGSVVTLSGITRSGYTGNNGTWTCVGGGGGSASNQWYFRGGEFTAGSTVTLTGCTCAGNIALGPSFTFGNDTSSSPVANSKGVSIDFFSFAWNPGVGGGTGTPNPLKARYW
jgi:hypothetical protein